MYKVIRPVLYRMNPEAVHHMTLQLLRLSGKIPLINNALHRMYSAPDRPVEVFGLRFKNQLGLAAGYDKDGLGWRGLKSLGFGHIEIGTVTLRSQQGNPKPRVFRLFQDKALINRMGFPGRGSDFVLNQLAFPRPEDLIIGVNIGKNRDTPLEEAPAEYGQLFRKFSPAVDYIAINVSSPNTVGLRRLQARQALDELLNSIEIERHKLIARKPVLVKLSPDLTEVELEDALDVIMKNAVDGVIATNTTIARPGLRSSRADEVGGLSGVPLHAMSVEMVAKIYKLTGGELPIVGVGGISDSFSAKEMLDAGAVLVQIYTGLIFEGPGVVSRILNYLH